MNKFRLLAEYDKPIKMKEYVDTQQQAHLTMSYFRKANPNPQFVQQLRSDDCIFSEEDVILQH